MPAVDSAINTDKNVLSGICERLKVAREHMLLGNYHSSVVYFEGVLDYISQYYRQLSASSENAPSSSFPLLKYWNDVKEKLYKEYLVVKEHRAELNAFSRVEKLPDYMVSSPNSNDPYGRDNGSPSDDPFDSAYNFLPYSYVYQQQQLPFGGYGGYGQQYQPFGGHSPVGRDPDVWPPPPPRNDNFMDPGAPLSRRAPPLRRNPAPAAPVSAPKKNAVPSFMYPKVQGRAQPAAASVAAGRGNAAGAAPANSAAAGRAVGRAGAAAGPNAQQAAAPAAAGVASAEDAAPQRPKFVPANPADKDLVELIEHDVLDLNLNVKWSSIAGLEEAKSLLEEAVIWPYLFKNFFTGIREPYKGVLMFGPPGTGKTLLAKAVATECKTTFFNVSVSMITSKWRGESEKLIRYLFEMARFYAPSTIFIDEIDSLCGKRGGDGEHEASRRVKTELLVQMDGVSAAAAAAAATENDNNTNADGSSSGASEDDDEPRKVVLVLGATNIPWDLDDAMRRRLEKRIYIPLPDHESRKAMFKLYLKDIALDPSVEADVIFDELAKITENYSGADIKSVCRDAAMMSLRRAKKAFAEHMVSMEDLKSKEAEFAKYPILLDDLRESVRKVSSSVSVEELEKFKAWMKEFGSV